MFHMDRFVEPDRDGHRFAFLCPTGPDAEDTFRMAILWCEATFGAYPSQTGSRWYPGKVTIWFRDEVDAFAFKMRWG